MSRNPDVVFAAEYVKNLLFFAAVRNGKTLVSTADVHYFCTDHELIYENYYSDFGPLNLGCVYKYCKLLNEKIKQYMNKQKIVHYTSVEAKTQANAAFLLGCFGVLYLKMTPVMAMKPLLENGHTFRPFQDATQGDSMYTITILDCLCAIRKAQALEFFNFQDFYYDEFERLDKIHGGDLNWIVPGKFLAFIGPVDYSLSLYHPPEMYIDYFIENNVKIVIRLNKRMYDAQVFNDAGIVHYDLFFPDGSTPSRHILLKFLQISEESDGAIAVHCKAGLGRTGSLIGCYLMKHYRMTAREAIGWMRICRPGSVIGHQQAWLEHMEPWLIKQGNIYRKRKYDDTERFPLHEFGVYSIAEKMSKQKPMILKSPSSPPQVKSKKVSETLPPKKEQVLTTAASKTPKAEQSDRRMTTVRPKPSNTCKVLTANQRVAPKVSRMATPRRGNGGGEPRTASPVLHPPHDKFSSILPQNRDLDPIPTFCTTKGPMIRTLTDAKEYLLRSSIHNQCKEKALNSSVTVTPLKSAGTVYKKERPNTYYEIGTTGRSPMQPVPRRRPLGRSPSPSPPTSPVRYRLSRGTDPMPEKNSLKEALSGLKLALAERRRRDGSIGAPSVGVASLGAAREAPRDSQAARAPSVRSDERSLATQGDMLNSIKFERRFRNTLNCDKPSSVFDKISNPKGLNATGADKSKVPSLFQRFGNMEESRWLNGRLNSGWRPTPAMVHSTSREYRTPRPVPPRTSLGPPSRPASPRRLRPPFY